MLIEETADWFVSNLLYGRARITHQQEARSY